MQVEEETG